MLDYVPHRDDVVALAVHGVEKVDSEEFPCAFACRRTRLDAHCLPTLIQGRSDEGAGAGAEIHEAYWTPNEALDVGDLLPGAPQLAPPVSDIRVRRTPAPVHVGHRSLWRWLGGLECEAASRALRHHGRHSERDGDPARWLRLSAEVAGHLRRPWKPLTLNHVLDHHLSDLAGRRHDGVVT
jgi:hypothetical protein